MLDRFYGISKFYIAKGKTDLRMGIEGLVQKITAEFKLNPYDGAAFLFCGTRSNSLKVIIWEGDGFTLMDKRFEQMDKRFEQMDKRFEQIDKRFEQVDKRLDLMQSLIYALMGLVFASPFIAIYLRDKKEAEDRKITDNMKGVLFVLREMAQNDEKLSKSLKAAGLL